MNYSDKLNEISKLIGNTPLLKIDCLFDNQSFCVFAKLEAFNLTGSIKDRMAFRIIEEAFKSGKLKETDEIVEATSGNTGISLAAIGCYLGHKVTIFMPDWMSSERIKLIKSYGANVRLVSREEGGFLGSIELAKQYAKEHNAFLPSQFSNPSNTKAHFDSTGPEIYQQMKEAKYPIQAFVSGVGTGGTLMGIGNYLKSKDLKVGIYAMEPASSPTLRTGINHGSHRIQGISDEFIPSLVNQNLYSEIIDVDDGDAIIMAQKLAKELGLGVGISSGANFIAAIKTLLKKGKQNIATVFPDDNKKYLSTDYGKKEEVKSDYISQKVKLLGYKVF